MEIVTIYFVGQQIFKYVGHLILYLLHIFSKGRYDYVLYNTLGVAVLSGQGNDNTTITTENIAPGYYTIVINGEERKLIK